MRFLLRRLTKADQRETGIYNGNILGYLFANMIRTPHNCWVAPEDGIYGVALQTLHFHAAFPAFVLYFVLRGLGRPQAHGGHVQSSQR